MQLSQKAAKDSIALQGNHWPQDHQILFPMKMERSKMVLPTKQKMFQIKAKMLLVKPKLGPEDGRTILSFLYSTISFSPLCWVKSKRPSFMPSLKCPLYTSPLLAFNWPQPFILPFFHWPTYCDPPEYHMVPCQAELLRVSGTPSISGPQYVPYGKTFKIEMIAAQHAFHFAISIWQRHIGIRTFGSVAYYTIHGAGASVGPQFSNYHHHW